MPLDELLFHTSEWLKGEGPNADIVISTRIRLARNVNLEAFPHWANEQQAKNIVDKIFLAAKSMSVFDGALFFDLAKLDNIDKQFLIERHLMSHEHALLTESKALIVDPGEVYSVMINEEDHLRIQVMKSGFDLESAYRIIDGIDNGFSQKLNFAFSKNWGYLTACPTNTGTGMRGSVMMHLAGLVMLQQVNKVLQAIGKLGFTARGLYGEGTQATGNFFQISNQYSLGRNEHEIIDNIFGVVQQIIEQEQLARQSLVKNHKLMLEDRIGRSLGVLKSAYLITSQETVEHLSIVRLGMDLGLIKDVNTKAINDLFILIQPSHLQKIEKRKLSSEERDQKRAQLIRESLIKK